MLRFIAAALALLTLARPRKAPAPPIIDPNAAPRLDPNAPPIYKPGPLGQGTFNQAWDLTLRALDGTPAGDALRTIQGAALAVWAVIPDSWKATGRLNPLWVPLSLTWGEVVERQGTDQPVFWPSGQKDVGQPVLLTPETHAAQFIGQYREAVRQGAPRPVLSMADWLRYKPKSANASGSLKARPVFLDLYSDPDSPYYDADLGARTARTLPATDRTRVVYGVERNVSEKFHGRAISTYPRNAPIELPTEQATIWGLFHGSLGLIAAKDPGPPPLLSQVEEESRLASPAAASQAIAEALAHAALTLTPSAFGFYRAALQELGERLGAPGFRPTPLPAPFSRDWQAKTRLAEGESRRRTTLIKEALQRLIT